MSRYSFKSNILFDCQFKIWEFINETFSFLDWCGKNEVAEQLDMNPEVSMQIIDSIMSNDDQEELFLDMLFSKCRSIVTIGQKGSGKTYFNQWLAYICEQLGYKIIYCNADFPVPDTWIEIDYEEKFPYKEVYELTLHRPILDTEKFEDVIRETRKAYAQGKNRNNYLIIHDEVSSNIDAKNFNSAGMKNLRQFQREMRKVGHRVITIHTDVLASNICIDFIRSVDGGICLNIVFIYWYIRNGFYDGICW